MQIYDSPKIGALEHHGKLILPRLAEWMIALLMIQYVFTSSANDSYTGDKWQTGEVAPEPPATLAKESRYSIPWGSGGMNLSAGISEVYVDNVFLTHTGARDDFILVPECDIAAFFPVGQSNTVALDIGLAYYQYLKNTALNTGTPLINPLLIPGKPGLRVRHPVL